MEKIYVKGIKVGEVSDLEELLRIGYKLNDSDFGDRGYFKETFSDEEQTIQQCQNSARRSMEDLMSISNTYFPGTTEKDIFNVLEKLDIRCYYCSDVRKFVFHRRGTINVQNFRLHVNSFEHTTLADGTYTCRQLADLYEGKKEVNNESVGSV